MEKYDVSIIIPNLNMGHCLGRAIDSVLNQSLCCKFEIIIVDGGSTDNSIQLIKNLSDERISLVHIKKWGISDARNLGVQSSNSDNICFLDADDEWFPNFLETVFRLKRQFPSAGLFSTSYIKYEPNNKIVYPHYVDIPKYPWEGLIPNYIRTSILSYPPVCILTVMMNKKVFLDVGGFKEGENMGEDSDLWFRVSLKYPIAFSWEKCAIYHHENVSNHKSHISRTPQEEPILISAQKALENDTTPKELLDDINELITKQKIGLVLHILLLGSNKKSRNILLSTRTKLFRKEKFCLLLISYIPSWLNKKVVLKLFY